jgi:GxxExxY protein
MALLYPTESYAIRGAIFEVHKQKGSGFLEKVYQECLEQEFIQRGIPYEREKRIKIDYKGKVLEQEYIADFVCYGKIIVECKAVKELVDVHRAQIINYLRATNLRLGFLVNFSEYFVVPERFVNFNWNSEQ